MRLTLPYLIFFVWFSIFSCSSSVSNPLNGKHLHVIWPSWSGNRKVLLGPLKGGVLLDYLSARFNFTHEMIPVESGLEPTVGRGQLNYLIDNQCDLLINNIIPTVSRNKIVDLTVPWTYDNFAILIPVPDETANINAVIKPFQWPIWLGLGVSIVGVIIALNMIQQFLDQPSKKETNAIELGHDKMVQAKSRNYYIYVFGMLLSQGGPCESKRLSIRLVAGVWTLATFIFVQAYSSILFTYVVAPVNRPLINSIYDIFDNSEINLFVRASSFAKDAIKVEFNRTGKCNLQFATEGFATIVSTFALPKQSPYTKTINQG
ncbi:hypothetical protein DAPPUDRAFT_241203 [Daphnia pulex]|uniref:Ionotropic glutamate receptor C-terminal domain-containing protein n=1 Tax=Daphnia pulex TaxID=6669 RepID=E9GDN9_DAPPU|nr:hypothetical protein DAPPUDRAFT_241203 [Daphnia pulex]|eukprot:EFX82115.1 hypothetical protein DAPPUDRAFT_241203 [Daphnia pulex]